MPDINHPVRHALTVLGVGDDPAVRSLYYRWAGFMADVRWERPASVWGFDANRMRADLLRHFNDDRVEMRRQMEILRGHVFAAVDHAKVEGAKKRAEAHELSLKLPQTVFNGYRNVESHYLGDGQWLNLESMGSHRYQK